MQKLKKATWTIFCQIFFRRKITRLPLGNQTTLKFKFNFKKKLAQLWIPTRFLDKRWSMVTITRLRHISCQFPLCSFQTIGWTKWFSIDSNGKKFLHFLWHVLISIENCHSSGAKRTWKKIEIKLVTPWLCYTYERHMHVNSNQTSSVSLLCLVRINVHQSFICIT